MKIKKQWKNKKWVSFSNKIKKRDNYSCLECQRTSEEASLQVHHTKYIENKLAWEYDLSDCITLCKGCHAREHNIIEPNKGWTLISISDLGDVIGLCERDGCGSSIRYQHLTYHPNWGYKIVGSTCIQHLTKEDKKISKYIVDVYKKINKFENESKWYKAKTKKNKNYIFCEYKHHKIEIYGKDNFYAYQIALKKKGVKFYDYQIKDLKFKNISLQKIVILSFIHLLASLEKDVDYKEKLREIYGQYN